MSAWKLLPVMLLSSPLVAIDHRDAAGIIAVAVVFPFVMVAAAPAIAFTLQRAGVDPGAAHSSLLARRVDRLWRETTDRPFRLYSGYEEFTDGVAFYSRSHPRAVHVLDGGDLNAFDAAIAREGIVLLCPASPHYPPGAVLCRDAANSVATRFPLGKRAEVEIARRSFGVAGEPARYLIITIPPPG
jgi:hypothetical protein